jgi:lipoprotein-releasing system ATP-binding protein
MIEGKNIFKSYKTVDVLKDVSININKGEVVSIVGASGAGKSTLLQILGTLDTPDKGEVIIDGTSIQALNEKQLAAFRNKNIGFVFQFHHLLPEFSALENVCLPAFIGGVSKSIAEKKAKELLDFIGLGHRLTHKPAELSGGEQQRVAIARALINNPIVVMADEPTGNLDSENSEEVNKLFLNLRDAYKQTFLMVTHNQQLAAMADRMLVMKDGVFV